MWSDEEDFLLEIRSSGMIEVAGGLRYLFCALVCCRESGFSDDYLGRNKGR